MTGRTIVHLVPHTHWDREWYEPFQTFRIRLVELIDALLPRMDADPRLRFTLDGQAATVDDYLEVRPEAEALIRRLIAERRLAIGPWQILMDEFLVSGETIVRNLEFGWARAEGLGGAMRVGYLPDMFGHVAQMPQILRRAGIDRAVVWRGVPQAVTRNTFGWSAPDGSQVETEYLVGGYGNGAYLFDVPARLATRLADYGRRNQAFYGDRSVLAMYGTDHAIPSPRLADLVDGVNTERGQIEVRIETLDEYLGREVDPGRGSSPEWSGELRSGARANMLMNVTSARVDIKAAAGRAERLLERYAEPLAALHGGPWPARLLELAWRRVVDNSAHDSICGCSHDAVGRQVMSRYAEAEQIGAGVVRSVMRRIAGQMSGTGWAVVNPSPHDRTDLVELDVALPAGSASFALRSAEHILASQEIGRRDRTIGTFRLRAAEVPEFLRRRRHGRELFGRQINGLTIEPPLDAHDGHRLTIVLDDLADPLELDVDELLERVDAAIAAGPDVVWEICAVASDRRRFLTLVRAPALGWTEIRAMDAAGEAVGAFADPVRATDRWLDNGLVRIDVGDDGTFRLAGGGTVLERVGRIVDGGEFGDSYNYGPPLTDLVVDQPSAVERRLVTNGPLRADLEVVGRYRWPAGVEPDGSARVAAANETVVTTRLEVRLGEPFVRVQVHIDNRSRDHRVRWHIPLPEPVEGSFAEGQFAVVERLLTVEGGHGEVPLPTFPAHGFVHAGGLTVLLDQVTEYEVVGGRELALTLLRSFSLISRNANPSREDPAGPEVAVPDAQLLTAVTARFALYPQPAAAWQTAAVAAAEHYRHPFLTVRGEAAAPAPPEASPSSPRGLRLEGDGVVMTALRRRGDWLELRVVNEGPGPVRAVVRGGIGAARIVDLLGRPGPDLVVVDGGLELDLGLAEIRTVQLRLATASPSASAAASDRRSAAIVGEPATG